MNKFLRETDDFFRQYMPDVTRRIFYVLAIAFLALYALNALGGRIPLVQLLVDRVFILTPYQAVLQGHLWQFVTYMFTHFDFLHLFFNALIFFFFGSMVENYIGSRRFFWFVMLAGVFAAVLHTALAFIFDATGPSENISRGLLGFSAVVYALTVATMVYFPRSTVYVFFFLPMPMAVLGAFILVLLGIDTLASIGAGTTGRGGIGDIAHAGGAIMGFLMVRYPIILNAACEIRLPGRRRRKGARVISLGHPGRHSDPDDLYDDPHWKLDQ